MKKDLYYITKTGKEERGFIYTIEDYNKLCNALKFIIGEDRELIPLDLGLKDYQKYLIAQNLLDKFDPEYFMDKYEDELKQYFSKEAYNWYKNS